jgi:hypothetical protein
MCITGVSDISNLTLHINPCHGFSVIAGVIDTSDKFIAGDNATSNKFIAGINDTGDH